MAAPSERSPDLAAELTFLDPNAGDLTPLPLEGLPEPKLVSDAHLQYSSSGLGAVLYLRRIQRYSSYAFTVFLSIHLANTSLIPLAVRSVPASETYLIMAREIYQSSLSEPLLVVAPVAAHVAAGVALRLVRRAQNRRWYGRDWTPPLSAVSTAGYALATLLSAHVVVNRVIPLYLDGGSSNIGLAFVAHAFARHPVYASLTYAGLIGLGSVHFVAGAAIWLGVLQPAAPIRAGLVKASRRRGRAAWVTVGSAAAVLATVWMAGALGVVARGGATHGWVGALYDRLYGAIRL